MFKKTYFLLLIFMGLYIHTGLAQVTISPTNLFIDSRTKFGSYLVINGSDDAQEITIDFTFSYAVADSSGNRTKVSDDETVRGKYSAADWVRAFPQSFTLQPGQRQTVRLRVNAPAEIENGVYWARIKTTVSPLSAPIEIQSNDAVTARVGFKLEQVTGLYYKKGDVKTGITIEDIQTHKEENGILKLLTKVKREGNGPFIGSIYATLYDKNSKAVRTSKLSTTIFFDEMVRLQMDVSDIPKGNYSLQMRFEAQRNDVPQEDLVPMDPVSKTTPVTIK